MNRQNACKSLIKYVGSELFPLTKNSNITVIGTQGKINKGWKGLLLDNLAGLKTSNQKEPDGLNFELKSVSYYFKDNHWFPKETMAITMLHTKDLKERHFQQTHLWNKIKSLVFCVVSWNGCNNISSKLLKVTSLDLYKDKQLIAQLTKDYDVIRKKAIKYGLE